MFTGNRLAGWPHGPPVAQVLSLASNRRGRQQRHLALRRRSPVIAPPKARVQSFLPEGVQETGRCHCWASGTASQRAVPEGAGGR
jgi:hypothetical protein